MTTTDVAWNGLVSELAVRVAPVVRQFEFEPDRKRLSDILSESPYVAAGARLAQPSPLVALPRASQFERGSCAAGDLAHGLGDMPTLKCQPW